ncbi:MAG: UDP-N-acetylglucosamine--N-acetylmuramyl-(pentapeptide) pyrophosphoryl-undecaprenol N-acetylglucosamine transferase [Akkermansia sp.]
MKTIVIACGGTGGHLFPGIAVAQQLKEMGHRPILLISRKEVDKEASQKYGDLEFHSIPAIAKPRTLSLKMPGFLVKLAGTYLRCRSILKRENADIVLGMGGFTSLAPIIAGHHLGLRTYIHDSNALPGRSNRLTAKWCNQVLLGLEEAAAYFPGRTCTITGTPVRSELSCLPEPAQAKQRLGLPADKALILVTGGSQGAKNLNSLLISAAQSDPDVHYLVIAGNNDQQRVRDLAAGAPNISVIGLCAAMPAAYAAADGVIARSGASTLTELSPIGQAALLIPYPHAADDHQAHNARVFAARGAAQMCRQNDLNSDIVRHFVHDTCLNPAARQAMEHAMRQLSRPDAARDIARAILA